ncbi:hypothetical protein D3C80_2067190 [compost metagenome]
MTDVSREPTLALEGLVKLISAILDRTGQYAELVSCIEPGKPFLSLLILNCGGQFGQGQNHPACTGPPNE